MKSAKLALVYLAGVTALIALLGAGGDWVAGGALTVRGTTTLATTRFSPSRTNYIYMPLSAHTTGSDAPALVYGTNSIYGFYNFSTATKTVLLKQEVPDAWDNTGDMSLRVYWTLPTGTGFKAGDNIDWQIKYRSVAMADNILGGLYVTADNRYTQSGAWTEGTTQLSTFNIAKGADNAPLAYDKILGFQLSSPSAATFAPYLVQTELAVPEDKLPDH